MTKREGLRSVAVGLALLTAIGTIWYAYFVPTTLDVAVAPPRSETAELLTALSAALEREHASVRINVIALPDHAQTAAALDGGRVDMAVVRPDVVVPRSALGIATVHTYKAVIAIRPGAEITRVADLRGRTVAVLGPANRALFDKVLSFYGIPQGSIGILPVADPADVAAAAADPRVAALFVAAPQGARGLSQALTDFQGASEAPITILSIADASAISSRFPAFTADEIAAGELANAPRLPAEDVTTLSFPSLLVASRRVSNAAAFEFTKQLFALRPSLMTEHAAAGRVEAMSTERGSPFSVHPGAATYYDATEAGFLERYSDVLWLLLFGFGSIASLVAWLFSLAFPKRRHLVQSEHAELVALLGQARRAVTTADLDAIEARVDAIVAQTSELLFQGTLAAERQPAFDLLLSRIETILQNRRGVIAASTVEQTGSVHP